VPELLGRINRAAVQNQLLLEKGEYKLSREADFRLARYEVTLPVSGDYARVRGFVNDVLEAVPSAALDELTLKRASIDSPDLEARVRFSLFLGAQ
jgi:Tfp pilus assembly protein PilO